MLSLAASEAHLGDELIAACREQGKSTYVAIDVAGSSLAEGEWLHVDTIPVLAISKSGELRITQVVKRAFDVAFLAIALVVLSPIFLIVSAAIAVRDGRPVFFSQNRGGLNGRTFPAHKFRTMIADAEDQRDALVSQNERTGPVFKIEDDPRVTPVGRFLRKTSIDELPQLWNVFKGEMSLVGPRPNRSSKWPPTTSGTDAACPCALVSRACGKSLRATIRTSTDRMELDLQYIDRWSLLLDLRILVLTPWALFRTPGH